MMKQFSFADAEEVGRVESRRPATGDPAYLLPPLSFGGASIAEPWSR
jgi:hypothetical protein